MSTTRLQEVLVCFGKKKQADIATAQAAADMWRFSKLNAALANPKLATENDAEEYGKGHEFPTADVQDGVGRERHAGEVSLRGDRRVGGRFGLGKVVKSGAGPYVYTCTPLMPSAGDAAELPYLSYVEQIRPGGGVVLDRQAVGMAVEAFQITLAPALAAPTARSASNWSAPARSSTPRPASRCPPRPRRSSCRPRRSRSRSTAWTM